MSAYNCKVTVVTFVGRRKSHETQYLKVAEIPKNTDELKEAIANQFQLSADKTMKLLYMDKDEDWITTSGENINEIHKIADYPSSSPIKYKCIVQNATESAGPVDPTEPVESSERAANPGRPKGTKRGPPKAPGASGASGGKYKMRWNKKEVEPDNDIIVSHNTKMTKSWTVYNNGKVAWPEKIAIMLFRPKGPKSNLPPPTLLPASDWEEIQNIDNLPEGGVQPGQSITVTINLETPNTTGIAQSFWKLVDITGERPKPFGMKLLVRFVVAERLPGELELE